MDELTAVGAVFVFALGVLLIGSCAGGDEQGELDEPSAPNELEQPQAAPPLDCRPVRFPNCSHPWNDRACFTVPSECSVSRGPAPSPAL